MPRDILLNVDTFKILRNTMSVLSNEKLDSLSKSLANCRGHDERVRLLLQIPEVKEYLLNAGRLGECISRMDDALKAALLSVIAIGEGDIVFYGWRRLPDLPVRLENLARRLEKIDRFYHLIGGVVGYHNTVLELIRGSEKRKVGEYNFLQPPRTDIFKETPGRERYVRWGIEGMPKMAEIYPVGGAGDRLNLIDTDNNEPLPAAELLFGGKSLLERLITDLNGRELLYERITGMPIEVPVVLMTSMEKDNDRRIREILESCRWFGRSPDSFYLIIQPLVPVISIEGHWVMSDDFELYQKPGGHGVLWKLMEDQGAFDWLREKGKSKALVRQINNPLAGEDDTLLAFTGVGLKEDKVFGFASCPRKVNAAEGMNVLVEREENGGTSYRLTNVEYTDFKKNGIEDEPEKKGSSYSQFPANTNILFIDLAEIRSCAAKYPVPGMLINLKSTASYRSPDGTIRELKAGRLESTMQNIADAIVFHSQEAQEQPVYLTYNSREKTIGVTKQSFDPSNHSEETPELCFYTLLKLHRDLLADGCGAKVPQLAAKEKYLESGPNVIFLFTPSLGPAYPVIAKKIRGGNFTDDSELQVELEGVDIENLHLSGSLLIKGKEGCAFCRLKDVRIRNRGIDRKNTVDYWKNDPVRHESMEIVFEGAGEFDADRIIFEGPQRIVVPNGVCLKALMKNGELIFEKMPMSKPATKWKLSFDAYDRIKAELD